MPTILRSLRSCLPLLCGLAFLAVPSSGHAAPLSEEDTKFLTIYEQVQKALIQDNLNAAKDAAHALANEQGAGLLKAADLKAARDAFSDLSKTAEQKVAGNPGYHVFYCPMVKRDWVQASATLANPYMGKEMLTCGVEKKGNKS